MVETTREHDAPAPRGLVRRGALVLVAAGVAGCALPRGAGDAELPTGEQPGFGEEWAAAISDMGRFPVFPPTEDLYVGDVYALPGPPEFGSRESPGGLPDGTTPRWKSLPVLSQLDAEYRRRPAWGGLAEPSRRPAPDETGERDESIYRADQVPVRHRIVALRTMGNLTFTAADLEPFIPLEVAPLIEGPVTSELFSVSIQPGEAESYSLSIDTLLRQLVDSAGGGSKPALKREHLRTLPLVADPGSGKAYLVVVTEVLYMRSLHATLRRRDAALPARGPDDAGTAAIQRAARMNEALAQSRIEDRIEGSIEFVMVTDDALTLRRSWPRPLVVAVRGITLEVDASTGEVLRTGPLGIELKELKTARRSSSKEEESEVLEERRRGADVEEPVSPEEARRTRLYWDYGPRFDALHGELSLFLGGRLHLDAATFSENDDIDAAFGEPDPGLESRRAFLELGGVYKQLDFNLWVNFSENELDGGGVSGVDFRNVFVGVRGLPAVGSARAGFFKEPFGLEEITSSNDTTFMERSLTDAFIERRNLGVMIQRRFTQERRMTAALGVYRSANTDLETGTGYGVTARVTGAPILTDDGRRVLHVGASATYRDPGDDGLRFLQRPESAQAQVLADTETFAADRDIRVGAEIGTVLGSLSFQSEVVVATSDGGPGVGDPTFWSTYVMGSYVLTGEHRSYRERVGAFGSVHPEEPFWKQGRGAVEVAARYSYLDLDSAGIDGGTLHDWTLGLNWYANHNVRVMFNYIAAHPEGFGFEHILQTRLQITF